MLNNIINYLTSFNFSLNAYTLSYVIILLCICYLFIRIREKLFERKVEYYKSHVTEYVKMLIKIEQCYVNFREFTFTLDNTNTIKEFMNKQRLIMEETAHFMETHLVNMQNRHHLMQIQNMLNLCDGMMEMFVDMVDTVEIVKEGKTINIEQYVDYMESGDRSILEQNSKKNIIENRVEIKENENNAKRP